MYIGIRKRRLRGLHLLHICGSCIYDQLFVQFGLFVISAVFSPEFLNLHRSHYGNKEQVDEPGPSEHPLVLAAIHILAS